MTAAPRFLFFLALASGTVPACSRQPAVADDVTVEWTLTPRTPVAGTATLAELTLRDSARALVRGAKLQVECHMSHPGMAPVLGKAAEREDGVYQIQVQLTMPGTWILLVTGELPDGRRINHRIDVNATGPAG